MCITLQQIRVFFLIIFFIFKVSGVHVAEPQLPACRRHRGILLCRESFAQWARCSIICLFFFFFLFPLLSSKMLGMSHSWRQQSSLDGVLS